MPRRRKRTQNEVTRAGRPISQGGGRQLALLATAAMLLAAAACGKNDMKHQVRIDPGERAALPAAGTVPVGGLEPPVLDEEVIDSLDNPVAATPDSVEEGRLLFAGHCAPCHGVNGEGDGLLIEELGELNDLAERAGPDVPDGYLYSIIRHGGVAMPAYGTDLEPRQRWNIVNFLRTLAQS